MKTRILDVCLKPATLALALLVVAGTPARSAQISVYDVTWDTSTLKNGYYDTPLGYGGFYAVFSLTNGGGLYNSSFIEMTNFDLGTEQPVSPPILDGGAYGNLATDVKLVDTQFANTLAQIFEPGDTFNFRLTTIISPDNGVFPDIFTLQLYVYADVPSPVGTFDLDGSNVFLRTNLSQGTLSFETYDAYASQINDSYTLPAPQLTLVSTAETPEPSTYALLGSGLLAIGLWRKRVKRTAS